jgi:hypothetical protein
MEAGLVQPVAVREGTKTMVNHENANRENVNCEQVWQEISNYVDGDVDATRRAEMDGHIRGCKKCASVLAGMQNVVRLYGDERMLEVPSGFSRRLEKRLAQNPAKKPSRWLTWEAWLVPVAALLLIAGGLKVTNRFSFHAPQKSILAPPANNIPPELQVVVSNGSKVFHVPGCPFIHDKNSERKMLAKEAILEGYSPCPRCLRQYLKTGLIRHSDETVADEEQEEHSEELTLGAAAQ